MKEKNTYHNGFEDKNFVDSLRSNPFQIPAGYFDDLTAKISIQVDLEKSASKTMPFSVPIDYFEQLNSTIISQVKLDSLSGQAMGNTVPEGYFANLSSRIISNARIDNLRKDENEFTTPEGYFQELPARVQASIIKNTLSPTLKTDGFEVPSDYFEELTNKITVAVSAQDREVKSAPRVVRFNIQGWIKYAAAACVTAILGITSYQTITDHNQVNVTESHLSSISEKEIINYLSSSTDSDDMLLIMEYLYQPTASQGIGSKVEYDEIEDYLNYTL